MIYVRKLMLLLVNVKWFWFKAEQSGQGNEELEVRKYLYYTNYSILITELAHLKKDVSFWTFL